MYKSNKSPSKTIQESLKEDDDTPVQYRRFTVRAKSSNQAQMCKKVKPVAVKDRPATSDFTYFPNK